MTVSVSDSINILSTTANSSEIVGCWGVSLAPSATSASTSIFASSATIVSPWGSTIASTMPGLLLAASASLVLPLVGKLFTSVVASSIVLSTIVSWDAPSCISTEVDCFEGSLLTPVDVPSSDSTSTATGSESSVSTVSESVVIWSGELSLSLTLKSTFILSTSASSSSSSWVLKSTLHASNITTRSSSDFCSVKSLLFSPDIVSDLISSLAGTFLPIPFFPRDLPFFFCFFSLSTPSSISNSSSLSLSCSIE